MTESKAEARDAAPGLAEDMAAQLRGRVTGGALRPGQRLSEAKLAAELDISRNTLREVFRLLTREGILRHEPNRGVFVAAPSLAAVLDIYAVRRMVEVGALAQAQPRHPAIAKMRAALDRAETARAAADWRGVGSANMEFHAAIVDLADSPRLNAFFEKLATELRLAFGLLDEPEVMHAPYVPMNGDLVAMIKRGESEDAALRLEQYLLQSERAVLAALTRLDTAHP